MSTPYQYNIGGDIINIAKIAHVQDPDRRKLIMVLLQEYQDSGGNLYKLERLINKIIEKEDKK